MVYKNCRTYGPYEGKDGRLRVCVVYPDLSKRTVSYPKYLMEKHLNRYLEKNETIDHKDENPLNNKLSNLNILIKGDHCRKHAKRLLPRSFSCPQCKKPFVLSGRRLHDAIQNRKRGKVGPFCNKRCGGIYGTDVQNKRIEVLDVIQIPVEYEPKIKEI